jgi:hypothetical protein
MSKIRLTRPSLLDGKSLFRIYWTDMGSQRSIRRLRENTGLNLQRGKPFSPRGLWLALWKWAINNPDEAFEIFTAANRDEGIFHTRQEWDEFLLEKAQGQN